MNSKLNDEAQQLAGLAGLLHQWWQNGPHGRGLDASGRLPLNEVDISALAFSIDEIYRRANALAELASSPGNGG